MEKLKEYLIQEFGKVSKIIDLDATRIQETKKKIKDLKQEKANLQAMLKADIDNKKNLKTTYTKSKAIDLEIEELEYLVEVLSSDTDKLAKNKDLISQFVKFNEFRKNETNRARRELAEFNEQAIKDLDDFIQKQQEQREEFERRYDWLRNFEKTVEKKSEPLRQSIEDAYGVDLAFSYFTSNLYNTIAKKQQQKEEEEKRRAEQEERERTGGFFQYW